MCGQVHTARRVRLRCRQASCNGSQQLSTTQTCTGTITVTLTRQLQLILAFSNLCGKQETLSETPLRGLQPCTIKSYQGLDQSVTCGQTGSTRMLTVNMWNPPRSHACNMQSKFMGSQLCLALQQAPASSRPCIVNVNRMPELPQTPSSSPVYTARPISHGTALDVPEATTINQDNLQALMTS